MCHALTGSGFRLDNSETDAAGVVSVLAKVEGE